MNKSGRRLVTLCCIFAALSLVGAWVARGAAMIRVASDPTIPENSNFFNYTFIHFEPFALYGVALFFAVVAFLPSQKKVTPDKMIPGLTWKRLPLLVAVIVLVATCVGRFAVHMNFDLCIDEYLTSFEARILDQHQLVANVAPEWQADAGAMHVAYQNINGQKGYWASGFLPGFALLDYIFGLAHFDWALSPVLAAAGILFLASLARRAFPGDATLAAGVAVLLLASSPQFLAMALTKFAWTAQLTGTLLWVWLFTHPKRGLFLLTPILGALLIGLHQPHVHPLVAAPFVLRLAREARWKEFGWFAIWYGIGACAWYPVYSILRPVGFAAGGDLNNLLPGQGFQIAAIAVALIFAVFHGVTLLAWTCPAMAPFLGLFVWGWRTQPIFVRDGICAALLTFCFYLLFPHPQGHGWGFRYLHSAYGLLALAGAGGALTLYREGFGPQMTKALLVSLAFSLLIQIPWRIYEIRTMVRPLALTWNYIATRPTDFVRIKTADFWYSWDLIRNDPWLQQKPIVFYDERLTPDQREELAGRGTVTVIGADEVKKFGVILSDPSKPPAQ